MESLENTDEYNHMYQIIMGKYTEVVRRGEELLPIDDPLVGEIVGQQVLELYED